MVCRVKFYGFLRRIGKPAFKCASGGGAGKIAMFFELSFKGFFIYFNPLLFCELLRQFPWEAERLQKVEGIFARDRSLLYYFRELTEAGFDDRIELTEF